MKDSTRQFVIFLSVFLTLYGGAHLYVWWRLLYPLRLDAWAAWTGRIVIVLLFLSFPLIHLALHRENGWLIATTNFVSAVWMGMIVYFVLITLAWEIVRAIFFRSIPFGPTVTVVITSLVALITIYGIIEAQSLGVTRLNVRLPNLPPHLEGMRVAQISDVHMGLIIRGARLERMVNRVNELQPDLIVITGDLVDAEALHMQDMVEPLRRLRCKYGVFAVTGNHEFYAGVESAQAFIEQGGVTMLRNRWVTVADGLQLIGWDDSVALRMIGAPRKPLKEIVAGLDRSKPAILLYHTPRTTLEELESLGIHLQLSGHTHQGQLWPFHWIVRMIFETHYGLFTNGKATIYVSRGAGTWGPPMRVLAPPEITLITLSRHD